MIPEAGVFAISCWALGGTFAALGVILRRSSAYWARQSARADQGLSKQPEPWFVRLTIRMHASPILRKILG